PHARLAQLLRRRGPRARREPAPPSGRVVLRGARRLVSDRRVRARRAPGDRVARARPALVCCGPLLDSVLSIASRALVEACERLGLDAGELLSAAGLTREEVFDPDRRIEASRADSLWQAAYARAGDASLALSAAEA